MPTLTNPVPVRDWNVLKQQWSHLKDLNLKQTGGEVDILVGLDHRHLSLPLEPPRTGEEGQPIAELTQFGWIVSGVLGVQTNTLKATIHTVFASSDVNDPLLMQVKEFCDSESFGTEFNTETLLSSGERYAVDHFEANLKKLPVGYQSKPTWKPDEPTLSNNYFQALNRFTGLQRRMERDPKFKRDYVKAINKYSDRQFSQKVPDWNCNDSNQSFLAHHGVYKNAEEEKVGKLRVVFDAANQFKGKSVNDCLEPGPCLQEPLPAVFSRFREGEVAWAADVGSHFSKIRLLPEDSRYFRYLWQEEGSDRVEAWEMVRLPFGLNCSPFIAISTTRKAAAESGASEAILQAVKRNMYVDDYTSSAPSIAAAVEEASGVDAALNYGDFILEGWVSNSAEFLMQMNIHGEQPTTAKILGIVWNLQEDSISLKVNKTEVNFTRVGLLSKVASLFDPMCLAAPLTVKAKIKLRELNDKGLKWKDAVEEEDRRWWVTWLLRYEELQNFKMDRCLFRNEDKIVECSLLTFCDASQEAYSAAVYLRIEYNDGLITSSLIKAATKLAPKTCLSIPKLELNAALLGSRLLGHTGSYITRPIQRRTLFTDSSCVRNWLRGVPSQYKPFFGSRIGECQLRTSPEEWRFVPGKLNPADLATRSAFNSEAVLPSLWTNGPEFVLKNRDSWPEDLPWMTVKEGLRKVKVNVAAVKPVFDWDAVTVSEEDLLTLTQQGSKIFELIKICQEEVYESEFKCIRKGKNLKPTSSLLTLSPFIGDDGLLHLGTRARRARLPYEVLHPPLLPGRHPLAEKIIKAFHLSCNHIGTDLVLVRSRQVIWITGGRELVKKVKVQCEFCHKRNAKAGTQFMGDLPSARLDFNSPVFSQTSSDLFGPFEVKTSRNCTKKVWGILYTCLTTRAIYATVVESQSTEHQILTLRQFIGLYSKPKKLWTDNGTNFVGADRVLREAAQDLYESKGFQEYCKRMGIDWNFQPPKTPNFGGSHESLVKSIKKALYRALDLQAEKKNFPTENQLRTILYEISGLLNTRPLTYASSDPEDFRPLTPADFLCRPVYADYPAGDDSDPNPREMYQQVQRTVTLFWDIWKGLYLQTLSSRAKWNKKERNFTVGDYCMELDHNLPRGEWKTGRVVQVYPGADGLVRAVDFKTDTGVYRRGIQALALLEPVSDVQKVIASHLRGRMFERS